MYQFRTELLGGLSEGCFETAVYRFLELHADAEADVLIAIHTDVQDAGLVKSVTLWSEDAVSQFERFWDLFRHETAAPAPVDGLAASAD